LNRPEESTLLEKGDGGFQWQRPALRELLGFLFALAASQQASNFILPRSGEKNSQRILAVLEKLL
jgi:hypothetical protein